MWNYFILALLHLPNVTQSCVLWYLLPWISVDQYKTSIKYNLQTKQKRNILLPEKLASLLLFTVFFPYRVSCPDRQGQANPLITQTADENESKMRPITTQAWLISLYRPLHTHWTHALSSHMHTQVSHVHKKLDTLRCLWINNVTQELRRGRGRW